MGKGGTVAVVLLAIASLLAGIWLATRSTESAQPHVADMPREYGTPQDNQPLQLPTGKPPARPDESYPVANAPSENAAPDPAATNLYVPDYGPELQRGGARITLELYDLDVNRVRVDGFEPQLRRAVGQRWVEEDICVDAGSNVIECLGLGRPGFTPTGLEPGSYEAVLVSEHEGCVRHKFEVARGETRVERVTLPTRTRNICITFLRPDGSPVPYIDFPPRVFSTSKPLEFEARSAPDEIEFRPPPTLPDEPVEVGLGGSGVSASGWGQFHRNGKVPSRFATDNGRWWVTVTEGCENLVSFHFTKELWGQTGYSFRSDFSTDGDQTVTLELANDFDERVLDPGKVSELYSEGNRDIATPPPFDPLTTPVESGYTRLVVRATGPNALTLFSFVGDTNRTESFLHSGNLHWCAYKDTKSCLIGYRAAGITTDRAEAEEIDLSAGGIIVIDRVAPLQELRRALPPISPTLDAFAHTRTLELKSEDGESAELCFERDGGQWRCVLPEVAPSTPGDTSIVHKLYGSDRFFQQPNGSRTSVTEREFGYMMSRRYVYAEQIEWTPAFLTAQLQAHEQETALNETPEFRNVLAFRAVDKQGAGLPCAIGLVLEYEHDAVASSVRDRCLAADSLPRIERENAEEYSATLDSLDGDFDAARLKSLIGESVYDAFGTDAERMWFARHGAWYDAGVRTRSDRHGYVVNQLPELRPGRTYVLYLWGGSRDDLRPDKRIVFEASRGVTDLGVIELPSYTS